MHKSLLKGTSHYLSVRWGWGRLGFRSIIQILDDPPPTKILKYNDPPPRNSQEIYPDPPPL